MSKRKNPEAKKPAMVTIYHVRGVTLTPGGFCGPITGVQVLANTARLWIKDHPKTWADKPWAKLEEPGEIEESGNAEESKNE